jgi:uncharacterized protein Usg
MTKKPKITLPTLDRETGRYELAEAKGELKRGFGVEAKGDAAFKKLLGGWSLATAQIFYRMPDARNVLQEYIWQDYDIVPEFPQLTKFLDFWQRELEGPLHSVRVTSAQMLRPVEIRAGHSEYTVGGATHSMRPMLN